MYRYLLRIHTRSYTYNDEDDNPTLRILKILIHLNDSVIKKFTKQLTLKMKKIKPIWRMKINEIPINPIAERWII